MEIHEPKTSKTTCLPAVQALTDLVRLLARSAARELSERQAASDSPEQSPNLTEKPP